MDDHNFQAYDQVQNNQIQQNNPNSQNMLGQVANNHASNNQQYRNPAQLDNQNNHNVSAQVHRIHNNSPHTNRNSHQGRSSSRHDSKNTGKSYSITNQGQNNFLGPSNNTQTNNIFLKGPNSGQKDIQEHQFNNQNQQHNFIIGPSDIPQIFNFSTSSLNTSVLPNRRKA